MSIIKILLFTKFVEKDGVVYRTSCECSKVYIGETGRPMQDRIKEHDRDIRLARTETSAVSEQSFQSQLTTPDTSHSGTKLSLLIVTLITTRSESKRQFILDFTLTTTSKGKKSINAEKNKNVELRHTQVFCGRLGVLCE